MLTVITKYNSITLLSVVVDINESYKTLGIKDADQLFNEAYKKLTERFQYYLQDKSRNNGDKVQSIIICDNRTRDEDHRLRSFHEFLIKGKGQYKSNYHNLVESVFIAPSHLSVGIQFADLVAGSVFRKFEKNDSTFFEQISCRLRRSNQGKIDGYGLVKLPKN